MTVIASWNVNGIRAVQKHGFLEWLAATQPDILCVQETKARPEQLDDTIIAPPGYDTFWASAKRPGYSGVAAFVSRRPLSVEPLGVAEFDDEGRVQILEYPKFTLLNAYFPNSQEEGKRLDYKLRFCDAVLARCEALRAAGRGVIVCGDYNIAHKPIDLKHPKENETSPGYLPEERAWMDKFVAAGYVDAFRVFNQAADQYTWWSYRSRARERNIGWRIDLFCVNREFAPHLRDARILSQVQGSDHCPTTLDFEA